ncbi:MAG: hypothetical protein K8F91_26995, partial [Candidatus Obscuribacterales bacterium]|nr:hypothetical protein [Candidatus Obscuribacterales bacterium]
MATLAAASVAYLPGNDSRAESMINLRFSLIAALITLSITGLTALLGAAPYIGPGIAMFVSSMTINTIVVYKYEAIKSTQHLKG